MMIYNDTSNSLFRIIRTIFKIVALFFFCRESIDLYSNFRPPSVVLQAGASVVGMGSSFLLPSMSSEQENESSMTDPFLSNKIENKKIDIVLTHEVSAGSSLKSMLLQPSTRPEHRASYLQSIFNGKHSVSSPSYTTVYICLLLS